MDRADANGLFSSPVSDGGTGGGGGRPLLFPLSSSAPAVDHPAAAGAGLRRKRGRPRKYGTAPSSSSSASPASAPVMKALSHLLSSPRQQAPPPSSSSARARKDGAFSSSASSSSRKAQLAALGTAGQGFKPLVITVAAGEDITQRITSSTQQHKHAFCIMSASGSVSSASLCQPDVIGGCVTYEGIFEIVSLSGSFLHTEAGGTSSRIGGLSICLSGADGRVVGGGVGGPLLAFGPVQVIAGSFIVDNDRDIGSTKTTDDSFSNLSTSQFGTNLLTSVTLNFTSESAGLNSSSGNDNNHSFTGNQNYYMVQHPMHLLPPRSSIDWRGAILVIFFTWFSCVVFSKEMQCTSSRKGMTMMKILMVSCR